MRSGAEVAMAVEGAASTVEAVDFTAGQVAGPMGAASVEAGGISARHEAGSTAGEFEDRHLQTDFVQAHHLPGAQTQA